MKSKICKKWGVVMGSIAHIRASDSKIQSVEEHLLGVKHLAESIGAKIGVGHIAGLAGLLHDMGKYTEEFKNYILEAVKNPDAPPKRGSVDHSTAGGKLLYERLHTGKPSPYPWILAELVGNAVISHHAYLQDFLGPDLESDYLKRVRDKQLREFETVKREFFQKVMNETEFHNYVSQAIEELEAYINKPSPLSYAGRLMFLAKFVFSALIDADRTNTRQFEENKTDEEQLDRTTLFRSYYDKLMDKLAEFQQVPDAHSPINVLRKQMSDQCDLFAEKPSDIYTLSIPTGGGKTLASLRYGLKHAIRTNKKHIIYVVPYTTIIEQNAEEVRNILQDDAHILEHHSNVIDDADDDDEMEDGTMSVRQKWKLAKDNWDAPIIFTTMVQFLNVFYAKGTRNIRRLHNLCESVIIFDEVQKVPIHCISLFNQALNFLKFYGRSSLVLCTATQPALDFVKHKIVKESDAEIVQNLDEIVQAFKRVEIIDRASEEVFDTDKLAGFVKEKLAEVNSILVILNTKTVVKRLFQQLNSVEVPVYHLSTSMCAAHRHDILTKVRTLLDNKEKVICISTQLIEAGVDASFECVIRSLAGLDSIAQAAGRCNRHGKDGIRQVYVIDHQEENLKELEEIRKGKEIAKRIFRDLRLDNSHHGGDILSTRAMNKYFQEFYSAFETSLDYFIKKLELNMLDLLMAERKSSPYIQGYTRNKRESLPLFLVNSYYTAAEYFQVIENHTTDVIVPYGAKGKDIIARLNGKGAIEELSHLLKDAQRYTVNLFPHERNQLMGNGGIVSLLDGKIQVLMESAYHEEFGVDLDNNSGFGLAML
jgi:CRISPR-associated endonuclease/helicase Cas3